MNAQIAPARDPETAKPSPRRVSATKSKPRNDTHRKILDVLANQTLTTNQITNLIGHESWIGVASALRAMHAHGEIVKLKSRDGRGIQSAKWRKARGGA